MNSNGIDVGAWVDRHPDGQVIAVLIAPGDAVGQFHSLVAGTAGGAQTLIATIALLDDLADRVTEHLHVEGAPQMLARVQHCRRLLLAEPVA
jgi:hypothetical protein